MSIYTQYKEVTYLYISASFEYCLGTRFISWDNMLFKLFDVHSLSSLEKFDSNPVRVTFDFLYFFFLPFNGCFG